MSEAATSCDCRHYGVYYYQAELDASTKIIHPENPIRTIVRDIFKGYQKQLTIHESEKLTKGLSAAIATFKHMLTTVAHESIEGLENVDVDTLVRCLGPAFPFLPTSPLFTNYREQDSGKEQNTFVRIEDTSNNNDSTSSDDINDTSSLASPNEIDIPSTPISPIFSPLIPYTTSPVPATQSTTRTISPSPIPILSARVPISSPSPRPKRKLTVAQRHRRIPNQIVVPDEEKGETITNSLDDGGPPPLEPLTQPPSQ